MTDEHWTKRRADGIIGWLRTFSAVLAVFVPVAAFSGAWIRAEMRNLNSDQDQQHEKVFVMRREYEVAVQADRDRYAGVQKQISEMAEEQKRQGRTLQRMAIRMGVHPEKDQ